MSEDTKRFDLVKRFIDERVRLPVTLEERLECVCDPISTNKIKTIVTAWKKDARVEVSAADVIERLTKLYGEPADGKSWRLKVFGSRGEMIDWDDTHSEPLGVRLTLQIKDLAAAKKAVETYTSEIVSQKVVLSRYEDLLTRATYRVGYLEGLIGQTG